MLKYLIPVLLVPVVSVYASATSDSLTVTIEGVNLSEDMSTLSSRNDEMLILIYDLTDSLNLAKPLLVEYFVLDSLQRTRAFNFVKPESNTRLLFFLVELDTDRTAGQVEAIFRRHHRAIREHFLKRDLAAVQKIIGEEDLIGFRTIKMADITGGYAISIKGRSKLDKFHYKIKIE